MQPDQDTFTIEEIEANSDRKRKLIELLKSGDAILMAGAGCSGSLFPTWGELIDRLRKEALYIDSNFDEDAKDFLHFAEKAKNTIGKSRYYCLINEIFEPRKPFYKPFHVTLCSLPFKAITTTNYDKVLEDALSSINKLSSDSLCFEGNVERSINEFFRSLNHSSNSISRKIVHFHGIYDKPETIVLSSSEYSEKYGFDLSVHDDTLYDRVVTKNITKEEFQKLLLQYGYKWPIRRKLLWALLATRRLVFIGFSMKDPYFEKMLYFIQQDIGTYNSETHFLLLRVTPDEIKRSTDFATMLKREYGIETIFFEDAEGMYDGLGNIITELAEIIYQDKKSEEDIGEIDTSVAEGDIKTTSYLMELVKKQASNGDQ